MALKSGIWVQAYLRRLELAMIPAYVVARGQADAGAVLVTCARLDGTAEAWMRGFDLASGARAWVRLAAGTEAEVEASARRQRSFDPDLWVIALESREGRTLLGEEGLE